MKKTAIYHGWTKSYSLAPKPETVQTSNAPKPNKLKDCFGMHF